MRVPQRISTQLNRAIAVLAVVALSGLVVAFSRHDNSGRFDSAQGKLEATIFSFDGQDFVRTKTTLMTPDGKTAVNTKLERESSAFTALTQKRSYTGEATVFGRRYDANYAPLFGTDGKVSGALFVAVAK